MKDRADAILHAAQAAYLDRNLRPRDPVLSEVERLAAAEDIPISDPEVGWLLQMLVRASGATRVLEVGSAIGYGAIWMARGGETTKVVGLERDAGRREVARTFLERAGLSDRVEILEGEASEVMRGLAPPFDLVYLDADKRDYRRLLDFSLQLLRVGGMIVIDNLLWKGQVADPPDDPADEDEQAEILRTFNGYFFMHPQLDSLILPIGDGLGLAIKKKLLVTDMGGPF
ncbi:MAG: O-methyltransferase [Thermoanaerobaculia bacterium]